MDEPTELLTDDVRVSPLQKSQAPLCAHHSALYMGMRGNKACAKKGCNSLGVCEDGGAPAVQVGLPCKVDARARQRARAIALDNIMHA